MVLPTEDTRSDYYLNHPSLQNCLDLRSLNAWKIAEKIFDRSPVLEIFEQSCNRYASSPENPGTTYFLRDSLDRVTLFPVAHGQPFSLELIGQ